MHTCCIYFLYFIFLSLSQSQSAFFFLDTHTHTPLWSDWCCKLAWACRWSGCDYCLAPRQLWWWHSVLWAPLAWACSKHNWAEQSLYLTTMHTYGLHTTEMHIVCLKAITFRCPFGFWYDSVKLGGDKKREQNKMATTTTRKRNRVTLLCLKLYSLCTSLLCCLLKFNLLLSPLLLLKSLRSVCVVTASVCIPFESSVCLPHWNAKLREQLCVGSLLSRQSHYMYTHTLLSKL